MIEMRCIETVVKALLLQFVKDVVVSLPQDRDSFCGRISGNVRSVAMMVRPRESYLLEFDQYLLHYDANTNHYYVHWKDSPGNIAAIQLCGSFPLDNCGITSGNQNECEKNIAWVYILFHRTTRTFRFMISLNLRQVVYLLANGNEQLISKADQMATTYHWLIGAISNKLKEFNLRKAVPIAFDRNNSEFYIVDNMNHRLYRWNTINNRVNFAIINVRNQVSALFFSDGEIRALLERLCTVFILKPDGQVRLNDQTIHGLLQCDSKSVFDAGNLGYFLSFCSCFALVGLICTHFIMFLIIEKVCIL